MPDTLSVSGTNCNVRRVFAGTSEGLPPGTHMLLVHVAPDDSRSVRYAVVADALLAMLRCPERLELTSIIIMDPLALPTAYYSLLDSMPERATQIHPRPAALDLLLKEINKVAGHIMDQFCVTADAFEMARVITPHMTVHRLRHELEQWIKVVALEWWGTDRWHIIWDCELKERVEHLYEHMHGIRSVITPALREVVKWVMEHSEDIADLTSDDEE